MTQQFCEQCGAPLLADARFCEQCGNLVQTSLSSPLPERTIGHIPVRFEAASSGPFARMKRGDYELVVTTTRLLLVRGGFLEEEVWLDEQSALEETVEITGTPWRQVVDAYDLGKELWHPLYTTPVDGMLSWHKANHAMPVETVAAADVALDPEDALDTLVLRLADGADLRFTLYLTMGRPAIQLLERALGRERVHIS